MKKFFFILLCSMLILSCEKSIPEKEDVELQSRSTETDCRSCDAISVSYSVSQTSECCVYTLNVNGVDPCRGGRQQVYVNGTLHAYVINATNSWNFTVCETPVTVKVVGFNQATQAWDDVCFEEVFRCSSCCNGVTAEVIPLGADEVGCCVYDVRMSNPGTCVLSVYNNLNQLVATINPGTSIVRNFELCPEDYTGNISVTYTIRTANNIICKSFNLTFVCAVSCCSDVSYSVTSHGSDANGCCNYTVDITNGGSCALTFEGPFGTLGTVSAGGNNQFYVSLCPSTYTGVNFVTFRIVADNGLLCKEFKLGYVCAQGGGGTDG